MSESDSSSPLSEISPETHGDETTTCHPNAIQNFDDTEPRICHCRFLNKKAMLNNKNIYDRIVTIVWSFNPRKSILTYGAAVYKKSCNNDYWYKQIHRDEANERFINAPIRISLVSKDNSNKFNSEITNHAMDWFISKVLVYKYGCYNKNKVDVRRIQGEEEIHQDFNEKYDPIYSDDIDDIDDSWNFNENCTRSRRDRDGCYNLFNVLLFCNIVLQTMIFTSKFYY